MARGGASNEGRPPARRRLARYGALARRALAWFPLTPLGIGVAILAGLAYFSIGVPKLDYVLQLVGLLAMALLVFSLLVVGVGALSLRRSLAALPAGLGGEAVLEAGAGRAEGLRLPRAPRVLGVCDLGWSWERPANVAVEVAREDGELVERFAGEVRGLAERVRRRIAVEDAFGLARIWLHHEEERRVFVQPAVGGLRSAPILRSTATGDELPMPHGDPIGERVDMRRYVAGDPLKLVLWKVFARSRQLMVRTPERSVAPSVRIVAYLVVGPGDEASAAAARVAVESGVLGDEWVLGVDGTDRVATEVDTALRLISASRRAPDEEPGPGGLASFLERFAARGEVRLFLFLPARPGPWLDAVTGPIARMAGRVTAIAATDRVLGDKPATLRDRVLKLPEPDDERATDEAAIGEIAGRLSRVGADVNVLLRPTGQVLRARAAQGRRVA